MRITLGNRSIGGLFRLTVPEKSAFQSLNELLKRISLGRSEKEGVIPWVEWWKAQSQAWGRAFFHSFIGLMAARFKVERQTCPPQLSRLLRVAPCPEKWVKHSVLRSKVRSVITHLVLSHYKGNHSRPFFSLRKGKRYGMLPWGLVRASTEFQVRSSSRTVYQASLSGQAML